MNEENLRQKTIKQRFFKINDNLFIAQKNLFNHNFIKWLLLFQVGPLTLIGILDFNIKYAVIYSLFFFNWVLWNAENIK